MDDPVVAVDVAAVLTVMLERVDLEELVAVVDMADNKVAAMEAALEDLLEELVVTHREVVAEDMPHLNNMVSLIASKV